MSVVVADITAQSATPEDRQDRHDDAVSSLQELHTLEELASWDGVNLPMRIGLCGKIFDVSASPNFQPDHGYGKLWAGKDATFALATISLAPEAPNKMDWKRLIDFLVESLH
eukprot:2954083-Amphidinium_carterae.1